MSERSLFFAVLDIDDPSERSAYLNRACAGDADLRARVEQLVKAHQDAGMFMQRPALTLDATIEDPIRERPGTIIGPYKLMEQLGEGGMGLVFVAEQQQPVRRKVALKVIKPGLDTRQVIARFEVERQALALMDHPNIAKVHDGGETAAGRPYFVMELVKGVPITEYCDQNQLPIRERLESFVHVCQAVQHAHQKGIIHRDLKPSNVMVMSHDGRPVVKVIDFGVAKVIGQQLTDKSIYTQFAQMVGTPLYMSPEQAGMSGLDVDTRSDIYSLGVLLYELLTGTTPFEYSRLREVGYDGIRRIIREEEPPKPSTRISTLGKAATTMSTQRQSEPKQLSRLIRGELDWIVMKALEKDRNRRYATANGLAMDVQRYLNDEPVLACPPTQLYRLGKFARRNKTRLAFAALITLFLFLIGAGSAWVVWDRIARQDALDNEVRRNLQSARNLIEASRWPDAQAMVNHAKKLLTAAGRGDPPQLLVELNRDLDCAQRLENIHSRPKTERFLITQELDDAYAEAFAQEGIDVSILSIPETAKLIQGRSIRRELGRALDFWSHVRQRRPSQRLPDWKQLIEIAEAADPDPWRDRLRQARRLGDRKSLESLASSADVSQLPAETVLFLSNALYQSGEKQRAMDLLRQECLLNPHNWWCNNLLGWWCLTANPPQYEEAIRYYSASMAARPQNSYTLCAIGQALLGKKADKEAQSTFARAVELDPTNAHLAREIARIEEKYGKRNEAIHYYSLALRLNASDWGIWDDRGMAYMAVNQHTKAVADFTTSLGLHTAAAWVWYHRGKAYQRLGQLGKAIADYSKAIEVDPKFTAARDSRGFVYCSLGQWANSIADYSDVVELEPKNYSAWNNRGHAYSQLGQQDKAIADFSKAIEVDEKRAFAWYNRANMYRILGQRDMAIADYSKAIEMDPKDAAAWFNRGFTYRDLGKLEKAVADFSKAIELDLKYAAAWLQRGLAYTALGQWDNAIRDYDKLLKLDPNSAQAQNNLAWLLATHPLEKLRQPKRAVELAKKAVEAASNDRANWNTLGVAQYRYQDFRASITSLQESIKRSQSGDSFNWFFLAMGHAQLGNQKEARVWYDKAVAWQEKHLPDDEELKRFRAEAATLLSVKENRHDASEPPRRQERQERKEQK